MYAFAGLNASTHRLHTDLGDRDHVEGGAFTRLLKLKQLNPQLKVTLAIGGWYMRSDDFSATVGDPTTRGTFVRSVVDYLRLHGFDGLDIDWQDPGSRGGRPQDRGNYVLLCRELRAEFDKYGLQLTVILSSRRESIEAGYDVMGLNQYTDYFYVIGYDYNGDWAGVTNANTPLYPRHDERGAQRELNLNFTISYLLSLGLAPSRLVPGLALFGRTFILEDQNKNAMGSPALTKGFPGPYTEANGTMAYNEICLQLQTGEWNQRWHSGHNISYAFKDNFWMTFEDRTSIDLKVKWAQSLGLGGVYVWTVDMDDFRGNCGDGRYPLLRQIRHSYGSREKRASTKTAATVTTTTTVPSTTTTTTTPNLTLDNALDGNSNHNPRRGVSGNDANNDNPSSSRSSSSSIQAPSPASGGGGDNLSSSSSSLSRSQTITPTSGGSGDEDTLPPVIACFTGMWERDRPAPWGFQFRDIDPTLCTHLVYSFAGFNKDTHQIEVQESDRDFFNQEGGFRRLASLKKVNPLLKVTIAMGGWFMRADDFSNTVRDPSTRGTFVASVVPFLRLHQLDGLVIDWQDPARENNTRALAHQDRENYVLLCQELSAVFAPLGLQLTVAVSGRRKVLLPGYDVRNLARFVDYLYVIGYDYNGDWEGIANPNTPLYARRSQPAAQKEMNLNYTISYLLSLGVPPQKLVPGIAFFGRTFTLVDHNKHSMGSPATKGFVGPYTNDPGSMSYFEICSQTSTRDWRKKEHPEHLVPYVYNLRQKQWISYDDTWSIQHKVQYAIEKRLRGVYVFTLGADDFLGNCSGGAYPLLSYINSALQGHRVQRIPVREEFVGSGCSMTTAADVTALIIRCGDGWEGEFRNCSESDEVPVNTIVAANCWDVAQPTMRCHADRYWRPYGDGGSDYADGRKTRTLCQPFYLNSQVCGRRPRYKSTGSLVQLDSFYDNKENRWPWLTALLRHNEPVCAATLVSPQYLVTAAHCVARSNADSSHTIDDRDLLVKFDNYGHGVRLQHGSSIFLHANYSASLQPPHDLALLKLETPVQFSRQLYPACVDLNTYLSDTPGMTFDRAATVANGQSSSPSSFSVQNEHQVYFRCTSSSGLCGNHLGISSDQFCVRTEEPSEVLHTGASGGPFLQNLGSDAEELWTVAGVVSHRRNVSTYCPSSSSQELTPSFRRAPPQQQDASLIIFTDTHSSRHWLTSIVNTDL